MKGKAPEEIGDLFVSESILTLKLLPSKRSASMPIRWFINGSVADRKAAARDIANIVERLRGKRKVVRGLTLMTSQGTQSDLKSTGLPQVITRAGFIPLN